MELPVNPGAAIGFTTEDGLSGQTVLALHLSTDGALWIGTSHGLTHFDGERFTRYRAAEGNRHVSAVATDRDGHIWIGSDRWGPQAWPELDSSVTRRPMV